MIILSNCTTNNVESQADLYQVDLLTIEEIENHPHLFDSTLIPNEHEIHRLVNNISLLWEIDSSRLSVYAFCLSDGLIQEYKRLDIRDNYKQYKLGEIPPHIYSAFKDEQNCRQPDYHKKYPRKKSFLTRLDGYKDEVILELIYL